MKNFIFILTFICPITFCYLFYKYCKRKDDYVGYMENAEEDIARILTGVMTMFEFIALICYLIFYFKTQ